MFLTLLVCISEIKDGLIALPRLQNKLELYQDKYLIMIRQYLSHSE